MYVGDKKLNDKTYESLPVLISEIENKIKNWKIDIALDGKNIQSAIVEQPSLVAYYDQLAVEANYYLSVAEMRVKRVRAERMRFIQENFTRSYTDTAIQKVIDGDKEYLKVHAVYVEIKRVYDECRSLVESFKQRSYSLNNLVKIYEKELENITIRT